VLWKHSSKSIVSKKFIQKGFLLLSFIQEGLEKFIKSLPNWIQIPTSIHFSSVAINVFLYPEWPLRSAAIIVSISLSFSLVYSIYQNATPHVSKSYLDVKRNRCTHTHKQSIHLSNHLIIYSSSIHQSLSPFLFTLGKQQSSHSRSKYQQPHPILRKIISL
jgi:hypothetical protein